MKKHHFTKNFIRCGLCGWGIECFWTGCHSIVCGKQKNLPCKTSVWMFPIYGMAALIEPIYCKMKGKNAVLRGTIYTACIFLTELGTGAFLKKKGCCPWDYSDAKVNYKGIVRLDYAPLWFLVGLLFEKIVRNESGS